MDNIDRSTITWSENPVYVPYILEVYENTEELYFAEDLVHYLMSNIIGSNFDVGEYSKNIDSPFDEVVRNAINCILCYILRPSRNKRTYPITSQLERRNPVEEKFKRFAHKLYLKYLSKCFDFTNFLYFCVDISIMAVTFYIRGMERAHKLAIGFILHYLSVYRECSCSFKTMEELKQYVEEYPTMTENTFDEAIDSLRGLLNISRSPQKEMLVSVASDSNPNSEDEAIRISYVTVDSGSVHSSEVLVGDSDIRAEAAGGSTPTESDTRYYKDPKIELLFPLPPRKNVTQGPADSSSSSDTNESTKSVVRYVENLNLESTLPRSSREEVVQAGALSSSNPNAYTESVSRYMENLNLESLLPRSSRKNIFQAGASSSSNPNADTESVVRCMENLKLESTLPLSSREVFQAGASSGSSLSEDEEAAEATGYVTDYWDLDFLEPRNFELSEGECNFYPITEEKLLASILEEC